MSYLKKAVKGASFVFFSESLSYILAYIFTLIVARSLPVKSVGLIYAIVGFFGLFMIIYDLGLNSSLVKFIPEFKIQKAWSKIKSAIILSLGGNIIMTVLIAAIILMFGSSLESHYFKASGAAIGLAVYAIAFVLAPVYNISNSTSQGFQDFVSFSTTRLVKSAATLLSTVVLFSLGFSFISPLMGYAIGTLVASLLFFWVIKRNFPAFWKIKKPVQLSLVKPFLVYGIPTLLLALSQNIIAYVNMNTQFFTRRFKFINS